MKRVLLLLGIVLLSTAGRAQSPALTPGDNLVLRGMPPVPAALAADVGRYANTRAAGFQDWHPTRREMLIGTRFGDAAQIHRVSHPGGARTQLTFSADPSTAGTYQPTRGEFFVFRRAAGGDEKYQNYRFDVGTGAVTRLTDGQSRNSRGIWSHAGDRMAYSSTRRNGSDVDLYVIDPTRPESDHRVAELAGGGWSALDWSPDDRQLLLYEYVSANESYLWLLDLTTGKRSPLTPRVAGPTVAYSGGQFSKDGKRVYTTTDRDNEYLRLISLDLHTHQLKPLSAHLPWDVEELALAKDGKSLAFITNEAGRGMLHLLDAATGKERSRPQLPAGSVSGLAWHNNSRDLAFRLDSASSPPDVYSLDVKTGRVERWTESETGGLDLRDLSEPELVRWKGHDGFGLSGFLYRPPARFTSKRPVIISVHGGPEGQSRPGFLGRNSYYLKELGVALLYPNVRGSSGFGKTYLAADNGVLREGSHEDLAALLDWIRTRPDLDPDRVMVMGGSYGGYMTLIAATQLSGRIRCAVDVVGISHLATFLQNTSGYRRDLRRAEYGDERDAAVRAFMDRTAPLNNVAKIRKPLFVVQGQNDPRVPYTEAEQIVAAAEKNGVPVWYLKAKDEGHGFLKKANADFQFYATVLFVKECLLGRSGS
ncbi:MAG: prolyl oligopeptidase family serine peptidase [Actinomycetota bacterium]